MGFHLKDKKLTLKGAFASISTSRLSITEISFQTSTRALQRLINCLIAALVYEERFSDKFKIGYKQNYSQFKDLQTMIMSWEISTKKAFRLVALISNGPMARFLRIGQLRNLLEGAILMLFRRMIDNRSRNESNTRYTFSKKLKFR
jgi:hypothetical protein